MATGPNISVPHDVRLSIRRKTLATGGHSFTAINISDIAICSIRDRHPVAFGGTHFSSRANLLVNSMEISLQ